MKIFKFKCVELSNDGRNLMIAFPADKIYKIETIWGSHAIYLKVNGVEVKTDDYTYETLIEAIEKAREFHR